MLLKSVRLMTLLPPIAWPNDFGNAVTMAEQTPELAEQAHRALTLAPAGKSSGKNNETQLPADDPPHSTYASATTIVSEPPVFIAISTLKRRAENSAKIWSWMAVVGKAS